METQKIIIVGAGGLGREVLAILKHPYFKSKYSVIGFVDDGKKVGEIINKKPVLGNIEWLVKEKNTSVFIAIGDPTIKKKVIKRLLLNLELKFPTLVHPNSSIQDIEYCEIGKGSLIGEYCVLTTNVIIGDFCLINNNCSLHHDTTIGSYSVIMPGVRITGGAQIGETCYISPNKTITDKRIIKKLSII
jgi:sugar O-acyltransferase (sialic acid O-acetyltransferase NeuD family)